MKNKETSLESTLSVLGQILGMIVIYAVIVGGWYGWYTAANKTGGSDGYQAERFGKKVFWGFVIFWCGSLFIVAGGLGVDPEGIRKVVRATIVLSILFGIITVIGVPYWISSCKSTNR